MAKIEPIQLNEINEAVENEATIKTNSKVNNVITANDLIVIKRDGREEKYDPLKMKKVCLWACDQNETYANQLLEKTKIKLYNKISIISVYDELIKTAVNSISRLYPIYEKIAAKLYLLKIYRESCNAKKSTDIPHFSVIIEKGLKAKIYNKKVYRSFSSEDIDRLSRALNFNNDLLFTFKSLHIFYSKYCLCSSKGKHFEAPQHAYMRVAMCLFYQEKEHRIEKIINFYNLISKQCFTVSTPIMLNSGTTNQQLSSCILSKMGDNAYSIMDTIENIAIYSKYKGGNAVDITDIRASGSYIVGNAGISSGPVPFIKIIESTIKSFNQGSSRPGVCCVYYPWWHLNFEELVCLKNNSGTEENRARHLKYSVKINNLLIKRLLNNENVTLFSPDQVPLLKNKYGEEFEKEYVRYEQNKNIRKKIISARELFRQIMKERVETGNVYIFHEENVNEASMLNRYINSSNLCCEIALPSVASSFNEQKERKFKDWYKHIKEYQTGEIALCNLSSINLTTWYYADEKQRKNIVDNVVRALDNSIDVANYPVIEAKVTNINYRYLGIGVLNFANLLAKEGIIFDSDEALEFEHKLFDELSYMIIKSSMELAKEKGPYHYFKQSRWAQGDLPIFRANKKALKLTKYQPDLNKWKELANDIKKYGLRNAQLMAIAPTATSGKAINATESIEPIQHIFYKEDGKIIVPTLIPNPELWRNYKEAFNCDQYQILKLAAIRQCYLDQSQSINIYFPKVTSLTDFTLFHIFGMELGIKTFYYCKTQKDSAEYVCESCT